MKHAKNRKTVRVTAIGAFILMALVGCQSNEENAVTTDDSIQSAQPETGAGDAQQAPEEATKAGKWTVVKSWEGTSLKSTEPFTITSNKWRIKWECSSISEEAAGQIFAIEVDRPGGDGSEVEIAANIVNQKSAKDVSYIYKSGEFFLKVINSNDRWKITVEEER